MSENMVILLAMAATVFAVRSVAFIFATYIVLPRFARKTLELLPPAILTVIVASSLFVEKDRSALNLSLANPYLLACIITMLIATRVKNFLLVILLGYVSYLLIAQIV